MFGKCKALSSFSVDDIDAARTFYEETLGIPTTDEAVGFKLHLSGTEIFIYPEGSGHQPASYYVLSILVDNIDKAVAELNQKHIKIESFEGLPQDKSGIVRGKARGMGPDLALFRDPAGNLLTVAEM